MNSSARGGALSARSPVSARSGGSARSAREKQNEEYIIQTQKVDPTKLPKLDTKMHSLEKDGETVRMPSQTNVCPLQLWEVYLAVAILCVQPPSDLLHSHIRAICEHDEDTQLVETVLREHTTCSNVVDTSQETSFAGFFEEYMRRKFQLQFNHDVLLNYITETMDDQWSGYGEIPRTFLLGPYVQAFLVQDRFFEGQYDEMIDAMRMYNLPVNDVLVDGDEDIMADAKDVSFDHARMYDDPTMILKKHGGWALGKTAPLLTKKDQLVMRLTGCTLDQLLAGRDVPDSPRSKANGALEEQQSFAMEEQKPPEEDGQEDSGSEAKEDSEESGSHASDYKIDPEHPKIVPFGLSLSEAYLLLRGLLISANSRRQDWEHSVVGQRVCKYYGDGHILCSAVLCDLYMRDQIDVHHWTLQEGSVAVPYDVQTRKGLSAMDHFLDHYVPYTDSMFRDMRMPAHLGEAPIWDSLEKKGFIDNHRPSAERKWGISRRPVDVWDLVRRDVLLDLREGYITAARLLYDKGFEDPTEEDPNDILMFCYLLQYLFDVSVEALNGFARVMQKLCPPFQKGELFPPLNGVHAGAVCIGLIDRASRLARGKDTQLAFEAAEFNEVVMQRLEEKFFLSPKIFEAMDQDNSGELTRTEFVEGMRNIDMYKEFRHERVPEDVLRMIVADLAERLFAEVDVNGDGTLTVEEIGVAIRRRRTEALRRQQKQQWFRKQISSIQQTVGLQKEGGNKAHEEAVKEAKHEELQARSREMKRRLEWQAEVEKIHLPDASVDLDVGVSVSLA